MPDLLTTDEAATPSERKIYELVANGATNKRSLFVSRRCHALCAVTRTPQRVTGPNG